MYIILEEPDRETVREMVERIQQKIRYKVPVTQSQKNLIPAATRQGKHKDELQKAMARAAERNKDVIVLVRLSAS